MKIDFAVRLQNLDGSTSEDGPTLAAITVRALVETIAGDEKATGEDKFKRADLARQILPAEALDLPVEQVAIIKERIGRAFPAVIVHSAWTALEKG